METEITIIPEEAKTVYINHPTASYGIFCYNSKGDLFLNSDWGVYGYAWRAYGDDFKKFIAQLNPDYVYNKFDTNARYLIKNGLPKHTRKPVEILLKAFIDFIKAEVEADNKKQIHEII